MAVTNLPQFQRKDRAPELEQPDAAPAPTQGLWFKLMLAVVPLALALAAGAAWLAQRSIEEGLDGSTFQLERANHARLAGAMTDIALRTQTLALTLSGLQTLAHLPEASLRSLVPSLVERRPQAQLIAAVGLWPEPAGANAPRESLLWIRDGQGPLTFREDYNDSRTIPYSREAWYTPARYLEPRRCYWSGVYQDLLGKRQVVTCSMRLEGSRGFEGVATVSLDVEALGAQFASLTENELGYAVLADRDGRLLALSGRARQGLGSQLATGRNVAELGQKQPALNGLVLALHARSEAFRNAGLHASGNDPRNLGTLRDNTRELSEADAASALAAVFGSAPAAISTLVQRDDPLLRETGYAVLSELPELHWQLASVTPARDGAALVRSIAERGLLLAAAAALLWLLMVILILQALVVRPLRRMARALAHPDSAEDPLQLTLNAVSRDEIGSVAHWMNERVRLLREQEDRRRVDRTQLANEISERQRAQETLARAEQRIAQTLAGVSDAVLYVNDHGQVESMNAAAEQLLDVEMAKVRGQPLAEIVALRLGGNNGAALDGLVETVIERGSRLEYPGGVFIGDGETARELALTAAALSSRAGRRIGAVIVMHPMTAGSAATAARIESRSPPPGFDPITGLGDRGACEALLRKLAGTEQTLAVCDLVQFAAVNEAGGHLVGDEVLAQVASRLATHAGSSDCVFRLPGDRFGLVLDATDEDGARQRAGEMQAAIVSAAFETARGRYTLEISIGLRVGRLELAPGELLAQASRACRAARLEPAKLAVWQEEMDHAAKAESADDVLWVQRIRGGLDRDLFHLTTQRIVETRSSGVSGSRLNAGLNAGMGGEGCEVLLALEDEEGFWAAPSAFLPVAERHGLTAELDRWVVEHAIRALEAQPTAATRMDFVGINLSASALTDFTFLDFLAERFGRTERELIGKLSFELRERDVLDHRQAAQRFAEAMRALGCGVAVDRHRSRGVSDMQLLREVPAGVVKLDATAYRNVVGDEAARMLAESQIRLLHHLGKQVVVMEIDEDAAIAIWRRIGADYVQGFAVARPSPIMFA